MDRTARVVLGAALVGAGVVARRGWGPLAALAGASLLATAYAEYCPLSQKLGFNTFRTQEPKLATQKPLVQETSEESFPASDAPAWTMGGQ